MQVANRLLAHLLPPIFRRLYHHKICWWTSHKWIMNKTGMHIQMESQTKHFSFRQVPCKWIYMRALTRHDPRNFQLFWWNPQGCTSKDPNFFSKHPQKKELPRQRARLPPPLLATELWSPGHPRSARSGPRTATLQRCDGCGSIRSIRCGDRDGLWGGDGRLASGTGSTGHSWAPWIYQEPAWIS